MSTVKKNTTNSRFVNLAQMNEVVFHTNDLGSIWGIENKNTLYTTLKRYVKQDLIYRIYRGMYSLFPANKVDPYLLGIKAMHKYSYISTETVLVNAGIILQDIKNITLISFKSKRFKIGDNSYYCRKLSNKYLFNDAGIIKKNGINIASVERAIADLLYFNKNYHFDNTNIDWDKVREIQKKIGYDITK